MASVYWIKSFVPIDRKSMRLTNMGRASAAAGISIMAPTSTASSNLTPSSRRLALACAIMASDWSISKACASMGIRMHLAKGRGAQDRPQLRQEQLRLGQAVTDGTQAQGGIQGRMVGLVERLVGADIERADGHE